MVLGGFIWFIWVSYLFVFFFFKPCMEMDLKFQSWKRKFEFEKHITENHNLSSKKLSNNTGYSLGPAPLLAQLGVKHKHTISAISLSDLQPRQASSNPKVTSKHSWAGEHQQEGQVGTQSSLKSRALWGLGKECTQQPGHNLRRQSIQVTGQLPICSALPGSQSENKQENQTHTCHNTPPALELISEDE